MDNCVIVNGYRYALPRYYSEKIFDRKDKIVLINQSLGVPFERYVSGVIYRDEDSYRKALKAFLNKHIRLGLTPAHKPKPYTPRIKRKSYLNRLTKKDVLQWLLHENPKTT